MPDFDVTANQTAPNVNLLGGMKSLADLEMAQAHASLFGAQARQANMRQNALQAFATAKSKGDPNALDIIAAVDPALAKEMQSYTQTGKQIGAQEKSGADWNKENPGAPQSAKDVSAFPDVAKSQAETAQTRTLTQKEQLDMHIKNAGMISNKAMALVDQAEKGTISKDQFRTEWNKILLEGHQSGLVNGMEYNNLFDAPIAQAKAFAQRGQQMAISAQEAVANSGQPAGNKKAAEMPFDVEQKRREAAIEVQKSMATPRDTSSEGGIQVPNPAVAGPGGPLDPASIGGQPMQPPGTTPLSPQTLGYSGATPPPSPAGPAAETPSAVPSKYGDIPIAPALQGPAPPGTIKQPMPKHVTEAVNKSNDVAQKIQSMGSEAELNKDSLARMETRLQTDVKTDALMPAKMKVAALVYALTKDLNVVKSMTGVNLPSAESLAKDMSRMGLTFARQTEGAREAVQAINIALGANPQMMNTTEGNLKIVKILEKVADWQSDRSKAFSEYGKAQATTGKNGLHYVGAEQWWNDNHPLTSYTSKVVPLSPPATAHQSADGLQKNTIYQTDKGKGMWSGKTDESGKPIFTAVK